MGHDVFISYSSADKTTADGVCALLESENIRCWFQAQDGQLTRTPDAGIPVKGNYAFDGNNSFTAASNTGTVTWKRAN